MKADDVDEKDSPTAPKRFQKRRVFRAKGWLITSIRNDRNNHPCLPLYLLPRDDVSRSLAFQHSFWLAGVATVAGFGGVDGENTTASHAVQTVARVRLQILACHEPKSLA